MVEDMDTRKTCSFFFCTLLRNERKDLLRFWGGVVYCLFSIAIKECACLETAVSVVRECLHVPFNIYDICGVAGGTVCHTEDHCS